MRWSTGTGDVVEVDQPGVPGPDPELAVERAGGQPGHPPLEQERRDALVPLRSIDAGEHQEVVGDVREADPDLLAVEPIAVPILAGRGLQVAGIGADARLGQPERRELVTLRLRDQPTLALLLGAPLQQGERIQPDVDALDDAERGIGTLELLAEEREADVVHPRSAVGLRDRRAEEPLLGHLREDLAMDLAVLVPLADVRQDLGLGEGAGGSLDELVLVGEREVDHRLHRTRRESATMPGREGPAATLGRWTPPSPLRPT